ncbi:JAB domain-containing protein [Aquabacterium humicola]|uniref:JAB domain-containing protein n=1 Tax=Aquabacterium humicola TaxID=3237377 RepID=UPI00254291F5|nr:JAB domain-containing protein [Rubrivivax pictus]
MKYELLSDAQLAAEVLGRDTSRLPRAAARCAEASPEENAASPRTLLRHRLDAARELLKRELQARLAEEPVLGTPDRLREWLRLHCGGLEREVFLGLFLDNQLRLIEAQTLFLGTLTQTSVYPREVVKAALVHNAAALAVAHNHPSGDGRPSRADEYLTQVLKASLAMVDVRLIDHFIVAGDRVVSMAEQGLV